MSSDLFLDKPIELSQFLLAMIRNKDKRVIIGSVIHPKETQYHPHFTVNLGPDYVHVYLDKTATNVIFFVRYGINDPTWLIKILQDDFHLDISLDAL